jgi:toxoflavin synthase
MTHREETAAQYSVAKASPIKRYAEETTFLRVAGDLRGRVVLDLACGYGYYTRALKRAGAERAVGVDVSHDMLAAARAEEAACPLGIEYRHGDAARIGRLGRFDVITAAYLFVYADTVQALGAMCHAVARNLVPGGRLIAVTINPRFSLTAQMPFERTGGWIELLDGDELHDGAAIRVRLGSNEATYEVQDYFWSAKTYERCLREAGLSDVEWYDIRPSEEGRRALGDAFWNEYLENPAIIVLTATRSRQRSRSAPMAEAPEG